MKKVAILSLMSLSLFRCNSDKSRKWLAPSLLPKSNPTDPAEEVYELGSGIYSCLTGQNEISEGLLGENESLCIIDSDDKTLYTDDDVPRFISSNERMVGNGDKFHVSGKNYSYEAKKALDITINKKYHELTVLNSKVFYLPVNAKTYTLEDDDLLP